MEIWKDINGYVGLYKISNKGRVLMKKGKISLGWDRGLGYRKVRLYKNNKHKSYYVHQIVARHFIPNPKNREYINHIDHNKGNNFVENLEWCTHKENISHAKRHGRLNGAPRLVLNQQTGIFYLSIKKAAKTLNKPANWLVVRLIGRVANNTDFIYA